MTIQQAKDSVAVKHGYDNWSNLCTRMLHITFRLTTFNKYQDEAMQLYADALAEEKCKEQRDMCADNVPVWPTEDMVDVRIACRETPLATYKP